MELNKEEALKAKEIAEKRFAKRDFHGARNYALKAKTLFPELDGVSQMVATFDVYVASEVRCNGEVDCYAILGLKPSANTDAIKKQYKKMAVLLHPDKNKTVGADGAFKLVSEAWALLSDNSKRHAYDIKRATQLASAANQPNLSSAHASAATSFNNYTNLSMSHGRLDTFWTVCTSCKVQYEYLRKYVNKKLRCKNCRGVFIAVETGAAPVNGSFPYCSWSNVAGNRHGGHGFEGVTYIPGDTGYFNGHGYEYVSNVSFQWNSSSGVYPQTLGPNGPCSVPVDNVGQTNGHFSTSGVKEKAGVNGKRVTKSKVANMNASTPFSYHEIFGSDSNGADKRRKVVAEASLRNGYVEKGPLAASDSGLANGNATVKYEHVVSSTPSEPSAKRIPVPPVFDARKLLIDKARTVIRKKLEEIKISSANAAAHGKSKTEFQVGMVGKTGRAPKTTNTDVSGRWLDKNRAGPVSINVPDSDFHDFDKDRSEECFKAKQIWALYDEEDGMPRLYCLIREIISVKPFKIHISYLNSKTDTEFGIVNWLEYGFTKSCGNFRSWHSDVIEHINIFSHVLSREKAGRGGCIRIYPRSGDIWAVYRNWSTNWDRSTPDDVRHRYEMVEVLVEYSEEHGVCICPLIKLNGFKTVYQRNSDKDAIRWIPRREMLRFSHQVPSYLLKGEADNLPEHCWDLDPAATPDELLHTATENEGVATPDELHPTATENEGVTEPQLSRAGE